MTNENGIFVISKDEARLLAAFASADPTLAALVRVVFRPAEGSATASDGHTIVRCNGAAKTGHPEFGVPRAAIERAAKAARKGESIVVGPTGVDVAGITIAVAQDDTLRYVQSIEKVKDSAPGADVAPGVAIGVNAKYLARVTLIAAAAESAGGKITIQPITDSWDAIRVTAGSVSALIMPMRLD